VTAKIYDNYDSAEFDNLVAVLDLYRSASCDSESCPPPEQPGLSLISPVDGEVVADIRVPGNYLMSLKRPSANQLLIVRHRWDSPTKSELLILDAANSFETVHQLETPNASGYTVYVGTSFVLSSDEQSAFYVMHAREENCDGGRECDISSVGVIDLEEAEFVGSVEMPRGCGAPVLVPTAESSVVASCRTTGDISVVNDQADIESSATLASGSAGNAFGFVRDDGSIAAVTWSGLVLYAEGGVAVREAELIEEGLRKDALNPPYPLDERRFTLGLEIDNSVNEILTIDLGEFDLVGGVETPGPIRSFIPYGQGVAMIGADGAMYIADELDGTVREIRPPLTESSLADGQANQVLIP
jgi:hypothetical protein